MLATVVFVNINGLKEFDTPTQHAYLSLLHKSLRLSKTTRQAGARVLSSPYGAVLVLPDSFKQVPLRYFSEGPLPKISKAGVPISVGIARGLVELVDDADGSLNLVGVPLNIAARLAANRNGVLIHESYADEFALQASTEHWLHRSNREEFAITVPGKRAETFRCYKNDDEIKVPVSQQKPKQFADAAQTYALLLAYDLPNFSDGDLTALVSRFRAVAATIKKLRTQYNSMDSYFLPGGDGGILAITNLAPEQALYVGESVADDLSAESKLRTAAGDTRVRVAMHYGAIQTYKNAENILRPVGVNIYDADMLGNDSIARKQLGSVIVSESLIESLTQGSQQLREKNFAEIDPLELRNRKIRRFVRRTKSSREESKVPP